MRSGASRIPLVLTVLTVLVLVGVVAVASTGSTTSGSDDTRKPADVLFDTVFTLSLVALLPAALLLVYGLSQRKDIAREIASGRYRRLGLLGFLAYVFLLTAVVYFGSRGWDRTPFVNEVGEQRFPLDPTTGVPTSGEGVTTYEPELAWIPVFVVIAVAAAGVAAYVVAARRHNRALSPAEGEVAEQLADLLDDTLDDLRAEPDPRRAVIAAYARLEHSLAASGFPRSQAETAEEYVARILGRLEVESGPVRMLTDLFELAKFSHHDVDVGMKEDAIAALAQIRDELRAAARRKQEDRQQALTAHGRAAPS